MSTLMRCLFLKQVYGIAILCVLMNVVPEQTVALQDSDLKVAEVHAMSFTQLQKKFYKAEIGHKISLHLQETSVEEAVREISKTAGLRLSYRGDTMVNKSVTLEQDEISVSEALDTVLEGTGLDYQISQKGYLLIAEREEDLVEDIDQETVTGTVTDAETGEVLPGVNVILQGTATGVTTRTDGTYSLEVSSEDDVLVFSFIGYETTEVPVEGRTNIDVELQPAVIGVGEVVVVGYGEQRRSTLTGAIASVPAEDLNVSAVASVEQALQGRIAGVDVRNNGGPGEDPIVQIRGISSINYGTDPLYIVDGVPRSISSINSRDIESMEVLKDASAAAIYGSRATNGVIMVTTKKGSRGEKLSVNYEGYAGVESPWNTIDLLNTEQYLQYERAINGAADISRPPRLQGNNMQQPIYPGASQTYAETNTDWQDSYFRNGLLTNHFLSLGGGNEISRFYMSGGYFDQEGVAVGLNYQRTNFQLNSDHQLSDWLTVGENMSLSYSKQRFDDTNGNRTRLVNVIRSLPYMPVHDPTTNGGFRTPENSIDGADPTNPVQDAVLLGQSYTNRTLINGNLFLNVDVTPWLAFRSVYGLNYANQFQDQFSPIYNSVGNNSSVSDINNNRNINTMHLFSQQLTFDQSFARHNVNAVVVYEYENQEIFTEISSGNQSTNALRTLAGATNVGHQTTRSEMRMISYVGRLSYGYDDRYLANVAFRRDGLSIWAPGNKWANFPSASIAWRIDREPFMREQRLFSELKIRGGYGVTGLNGQLIGDNYPWQVDVQANNATYPFNNEVSTGNSSYIDEMANIDLEWEKTSQWNVGLDLGFMANRLQFVVDYYYRYTDNLLLNVPIPFSFGLNTGGQGSATAGVLDNVGEMENSGLDFQLTYHKVGGSFNWDVTGLVSVVQNEVVSMATPTATIGAGGDQDFGGGENLTRTEAGHSIQSFYGYVVEGIFQNENEIANAPTQSGAAPGDIRFADLNGDGVINADDRTFIGSFIPDFNYSLNFNGYYKNFDFSVFLQGVQGNDIFNAAGVIRQGMLRLFGADVAVLDAWTPENRDTDVPRAISGDPNGNARPSTRWIEDGSYLRLKNLQVGYTIPATRLASFTGGAMNNLRVYLAAQNLFTITNYSGWDPEIGSKNNTLTNGIDYGQYPAARSLMLGVQMEF